MSSELLQYEFRDGIYMLSLLRCLEKGNIEEKDIKNFNFDECYEIIKESDYFKESFRQPYLKLKDRIENINNIIFESYFNFKFNEKEQDVIDSFLEYGTLNSFEEINELLDKLEKSLNTNIKRPETTTYQELKNINNPNIEKLEKFWSKFWENRRNSTDPYFKLSNAITSFNYSITYGKNGCVEPKGKFLQVRDRIPEAINLMKNTEKLDSNFFVYRSIIESKSFNPEDKINNLLLGKSIVEKYLTLISTTWDLDFAIKWSEDKYCCLYVIEVPKDSNYLILKDSFDLSERYGKIISQREITLGPGEIEFNEIKITNVKYVNDLGEHTKGIFIFYGKYKSYSKEDLSKNFDNLLCQEEKTSKSSNRKEDEEEDSHKSKKSKFYMRNKLFK